MREAKLPGGNVASKVHDSIHGQALAGAARASRRPAPMPWRAQHPPEIRSTELYASRPDTRHLWRLPYKGASGLRAGRARQAAPGRQPRSARLQRLPRSPHDSTARPAVVPDRSDQGMRQLPCGLLGDLSRYVPRAGHRTWLLARRYLRILPRLAPDLPASNPASTVSPQNRVKTCQKCHDRANVNSPTTIRMPIVTIARVTRCITTPASSWNGC